MGRCQKFNNNSLSGKNFFYLVLKCRALVSAHDRKIMFPTNAEIKKTFSMRFVLERLLLKNRKYLEYLLIRLCTFMSRNKTNELSQFRDMNTHK